MNELPFDPIQLMREHPEKMRVPGNLFSSGGADDYVGAVPAISGVLFFEGAHEPLVREAICACFDEYAALAGEHLTWLWREDAPAGPARIAYPKARPLQVLMKQLSADQLVSFTYTSGTKADDAGEWEFQVHGIRGWKVKMGGWGLSTLRFTIPLLHVEDHPTAFQAMFVQFARRLNAVHGYGGHALVLSASQAYENHPFEAYLAKLLNGLDAGDLIAAGSDADKGIKTVSWLTAVDYAMVERVGGIDVLRSELPMDWFALYDYGNGIVVQAGPAPEAAPVDADAKPARLALPNHLFKKVRAPEVGMHTGSVNGEPRLVGRAAEQWLERFDIDSSELMTYKAKLLDEPKLTPDSTLPDRL
ncbi:DUF3396 domain-containing protein [Pseudoduganella sp. SL102]|uniref:type VI immunity family protein n=1 Tax=Pseudoduganella sp. SL102 TaxID=2995154 RepID=UPI00248CA69D|nr:type VI immunity family protein [Pseudoduganella sp. SL102]WBS00874.1 DUF3396 domain-containing protein [Pseudoduganella sp. SL102]